MSYAEEGHCSHKSVILGPVVLIQDLYGFGMNVTHGV